MMRRLDIVEGVAGSRDKGECEGEKTERERGERRMRQGVARKDEELDLADPFFVTSPDIRGGSRVNDILYFSTEGGAG